MLGFIINNKKPLKINDIAEKYNISPRTIRYDLDKIDKYLKEMGLEGLTRRPNEGVSISIKNGDIEILSKALDGINCYDYVMSQDERVHYIICELLRKDEYTTINSMANKMFVSRGTISNDLKEVKKIFEKNKIKLESIKGKGVKALGDEVKLRSIASNIMFKSSDMTSNFNINIMKMFKDIDVEFISNLIKSAENQMRNTLSDYAFNNLVIHIMISIKRIQLCKDILMDEKELKNLIKTPEFSIAAGVTKMLEERYHINIPESEIGYIAIHFLASNVMLTKKRVRIYYIYN
jgi:transcriptional antiterminator